MASEDLTVPFFRNLPKLNEAETKKQGRPIYDDQIVCEIRFAANKQTVGVFPANEVFRWQDEPDGSRTPLTYALAYNEQYQKFINGDGQSLSGTPLAELPFLTASKRLELKALNVHTAEALAALDGAPLKALGMQGREFQKQAAAYLEKASGTADYSHLVDENAALAERIAELEARAAKAEKASEKKPDNDDADDEEEKDASPFETFEDEDIRNWLKDTSPETEVHARLGRKKLIALADEVNAKLAAKNQGV